MLTIVDGHGKFQLEDAGSIKILFKMLESKERFHDPGLPPIGGGDSREPQVYANNRLLCEVNLAQAHFVTKKGKFIIPKDLEKQIDEIVKGPVNPWEITRRNLTNAGEKNTSFKVRDIGKDREINKVTKKFMEIFIQQNAGYNHHEKSGVVYEFKQNDSLYMWYDETIKVFGCVGQTKGIQLAEEDNDIMVKMLQDINFSKHAIYKR